MFARLLVATVLTFATLASPTHAAQTLITADRFLAPAETWQQCVNVPGGRLLLSATIGENQMGEQVRMDLSQSVGGYASPLSVVTATPGELFAVHRVEAGEYCVRASLSKHLDRYVPGREPPLWTATRIGVTLEHEP